MCPADTAAPRTALGTPARLIALGAALGFGPAVLDATLSFSSNLALLGGTLGAVPYDAFLLDVALVGLLVPVGFFLALCGIMISLRMLRPPGPRRAFWIGLGGAGVNLAAGLIQGVLNLSVYLMPAALLTVSFLRSLVVTSFVATVAEAVGLMTVLGATAVLVARDPVARPRHRGARLRLRRGKKIYQAVPSGR